MSLLGRLVLAAFTAFGAAVGFVLGAISGFALGALGWVMGVALLVLVTSAGAILAKRILRSAGSTWPMVVATLAGLLLVALVQNQLMPCVIGDAVMWECAEAPLAGALVAAIVCALSIDSRSRKAAAWDGPKDP
jgi:hypothetical protein